MIKISEDDLRALADGARNTFVSRERNVMFSDTGKRLTDAEFLALCYLDSAVAVLKKKSIITQEQCHLEGVEQT